MFVAQPQESVAAVARAVAALGQGAGRRAERLAALHVMTTLSGSVLIALALVEGALDFDGGLGGGACRRGPPDAPLGRR